ncbi:MAG: polysaccharide biosynthesis/export family protein [Pseudomonadota bacterium]
MKLHKKLIAHFVVAISFVVTACQTPTTVSQPEVVTSPNIPLVYQLGTGDQIRISVFGQPDLSGQFEVDGTGSIALPLIGTIRAQGMSTSELEKSIYDRLIDGYVRDPQVSAEVINYRPFYILGEVSRPGEYPYTNNLTVLNAVASAGGFTYRANKKIVYIKTVESDREVSIQLDSNTTVQPGDTIRIGERIF